MDQKLISLRQREIETSIVFIRVQLVYLDATAPYAGKPESELKEAAEGYRKAIELYDDALQELREYLLAAEPSEAIAMELEHTERLINALEKEKRMGSKLIERHIKLTGRQAEDE